MGSRLGEDGDNLTRNVKENKKIVNTSMNAILIRLSTMEKDMETWQKEKEEWEKDRTKWEEEKIAMQAQMETMKDGLEPNLKDDVHKFNPSTVDAAIVYVERLGDNRRHSRNFFPGERSYNNTRSFQRDNRGRYGQNQRSSNFQPAKQYSGQQSAGQHFFRPHFYGQAAPSQTGSSSNGFRSRGRPDKIGDEMTAVIFHGILLLDNTLLLHRHLPPLSQVGKDYALFVMVIIGDKGKQAVLAVRVSKVVSALILNANTNVSVPINLSNQVLSLLGFVGKHPLNVLVDSGCSINFVITTLGFIKYDPIISFRDHSIRLYHSNQELELRGLFNTQPITMVSAMQVKRVIRKRDCTTALVMLREAEDDTEIQSEASTTDTEYLQKPFFHQLMDLFRDELPTTLPPRRPVDHTIDLIPGQPPPVRAPSRVSYSESQAIQKQLEDFFVTEDRKTANEVILYFQEHKISVVQCEILSELARPYINGDSAPNHCGKGKPIMEYIVCNDMYKAVFWKYLRNWYIVDNRNAAITFVNGGKDTGSHENIVTVKGDIFKQDGEVISATTHVSGDYLLQSWFDDGRSSRRGAISPTEIKEYKDRIKYLSERQSMLKEEIIIHENKATALQTQVRELQTQLHNLQEGTHVDTLSSLDFQLAEKRKILAEVQCKIQNLEIGASEMRNSILLLQNLQDRAMSPAMAEWRKIFEILDGEIKGCDLEIQKKTSSMKSKISKLNGVDIIATELLSKDAQLAEAEHFYAQAKSQLDIESLQRDTLSSEVDKVSQSLVVSGQLADTYKKKIGALHRKETELKTQLEKFSDSDLDLKEKINKILKALPEYSEDLPSKRMLHDFTDLVDANNLGTDEEDMRGVALAEEELSLKNLHETINPCTLDEDLSYRKEELQIAEKLETLENTLDTLKLKKEALENERYNVFMKSVKDVNDTLSRVYGSFTKHGDAYLSFTEEKTLLFTEGVNFQVRPGQHKWCSFSILSGGQQALAALALSFSLQHQFPSPFYFFDEIDAALDTKNTQLVANYVMKQRCTQYIIVSHRPQLYEEASTIAGIYHSCGSSRSITAQT
ncbi:hypothetical protein L7F22_053426 [Adiantum nelumboides]|nr:hypothetical protein [Adiantum nelumboides]